MSCACSLLILRAVLTTPRVEGPTSVCSWSGVKLLNQRVNKSQRSSCFDITRGSLLLLLFLRRNSGVRHLLYLQQDAVGSMC